MVIVDTSVWINHFRNGDEVLSQVLREGKVAIHEFILGELACGSFKNRDEVIDLLKNLSRSKKVTLEEYLLFIKKNELYGKGIGFVDIHLLASSKLSGYTLLTYDKKLESEAKILGLNFR